MSTAAFLVEEGSHYNTRLIKSWPFLGTTEFKKTVEFTSSCIYTLPDYNQEDVNKLFGASFGLGRVSCKSTPHFVSGIHWKSARFGWRWSRSAQKIELLAYVYDHGERNWDSQMRFPVIAQIEIGEKVECSIKVTDTAYIFHVTKGDVSVGQMVSVAHGKLPSWGLTASFYFGGGLPAPQPVYAFID